MQWQHEAHIHEALFYEAQEVLDGKRKGQRKKDVADDQIPLRGFLVCPRCGRLLTGSGSKGRKYRYNYYHCRSACGALYRADFVNGAFERELRKYVSHKTATELYKEVLLVAWNAKGHDQRQRKRALLKQIDELNGRIAKGRELLLAGDIDAVDFKTIKT